MRASNMFVLWMLGLCLVTAGCSFKKAEEKGKQIFPEVQKFDRLMDKTSCDIGWHVGIGSHLAWCSRGIVYGRYLIYMKFNVSVNGFNEPKRMSDPVYTIAEYWYENDASGRAYVTYTIRKDLSHAQWDQVNTVDDIFKIAGIVPITNQPIDGIEEGLKFY